MKLLKTLLITLVFTSTAGHAQAWSIMDYQRRWMPPIIDHPECCLPLTRCPLMKHRPVICATL